MKVITIPVDSCGSCPYLAFVGVVDNQNVMCTHTGRVVNAVVVNPKSILTDCPLEDKETADASDH